MNSQSAMSPFLRRSESSAENIASQRGSVAEDLARVRAVRDRAQRAHEVARRELIAHLLAPRRRRARRLVFQLGRIPDGRFFGGAGSEIVVPSRSVSGIIFGRERRGARTSFSSASTSGSASGLSSSGGAGSLGAGGGRTEDGAIFGADGAGLRGGGAAGACAALGGGAAAAAAAVAGGRGRRGRREDRGRRGGGLAEVVDADRARGCRSGTRSSASPGAPRRAPPPGARPRSSDRPSRRRASRPASHVPHEDRDEAVLLGDLARHEVRAAGARNRRGRATPTARSAAARASA